MEIELWDHQEDAIQQILEEFKTFRSVCYQAPTAAGKTVTVSHLHKYISRNLKDS